MEQLINHAAVVGVIVTLLCSASITQCVRDAALPLTKVLECPYCTSFWVALVVDPSKTYFATVLFGNIAIMLVHWSMASKDSQDDNSEAPASPGH